MMKKILITLTVKFRYHAERREKDICPDMGG
jgi:hypothetical protein